MGLWSSHIVSDENVLAGNCELSSDFQTRDILMQNKINSLEAELKRLQWHDVKLELPKENRDYLVSYDENCKHSFYILHYDDSDWYKEGSELSVSKPYWWREIY